MLKGGVTIFEKERELGGLCRSQVGDVTFDRFGPHILGGIPEAVDWIIQSTGLDFVEGSTSNVGWIGGRFVKHPFEDEAVGRRYQTKMWKRDPSILSSPGLSAQKGRRPGGVAKFRYPAKGGYQAITDAWGRQVDVQFGCKFTLTSVQTLRTYDRIVWCAPIPGMAYNRLTTVTLRYRGEAPPFTAIYLPESDTPFHRVSFPTAFSTHNSAPDEFLMQGEVSGETLLFPQDDLKNLGEALGLGAPVPGSDRINVEANAYPIPDGSQLPSTDLYFHGRSGAHSYLNLDGVVKASMQLAEELNGSE